MPAPTTAQYALGRNSFFTLQEANINAATGGTPAPGPVIPVCTQTGTISLSANVISILNNCNFGWEVKLPGLKSGTISLTGHAASNNGGNALQILRSFGQIVNWSCDIRNSNNETVGFLSGQGVLTGCETSLDVNEAVNVDLTIEISGSIGDNNFLNLAESS